MSPNWPDQPARTRHSRNRFLAHLSVREHGVAVHTSREQPSLLKDGSAFPLRLATRIHVVNSVRWSRLFAVAAL
jgi:hypothetical protein